MLVFHYVLFLFSEAAKGSRISKYMFAIRRYNIRSLEQSKTKKSKQILKMAEKKHNHSKIP